MKLNLPIFWKGIDERILQYFQNNPNMFHHLDKIRDFLMDNDPMLHTWEIIMRCYVQNGIKGKLRQSIHRWQTEGFPIISSAKHGKGYIYIEYDNPDAPKYWQDKFKANKTRRDIAKNEKENDTIMFTKYLQKCQLAKVRQELKAIAVKHNINFNMERHG